MSETEIKEIVRILCSNNHRVSGSEYNYLARDFLVNQLDSLNLKPLYGDSYLHKYKVGNSNFFNVSGILESENKSNNIVLIGAHYDTCGEQPGADDNAAGVAAILNSIPSLNPVNKSIIISFFDSEEPPYYLTKNMGSIRLYEDVLSDRYNIEYALILDCIGHDLPINGIEDYIAVLGTESSKTISNVFKKIPDSKELTKLFIRNDNLWEFEKNDIGDLSDHHIFRVNGIPFTFLTTGRTKRYHQVSDTPDWLNYKKINKISQLVPNVINDLTEYEERIDPIPHNNIKMEIKSIDKFLSRTTLIRNRFPSTIKDAFGIQNIRSEEDIRTMVGILSKFI